jgi:predicted TIM-barrel fold metal-dependent hydrolase
VPTTASADLVVDCHCHAGTGDGLTGPWDTRAALDGYLRRADAAGIGRTVLFAPFHSDYLTANREVARIVKAAPRRFLGFAVVHPERDRGRVSAMVAEAVTVHGFRGIKAHAHDGRLTREVCEVARRWRLPVLYDVLGDIAPIELFAEEYRQVSFVIPHLGSFADDWRAQRSFLDVLERHPNVLTDTSGVRRFDLLVEAVRRGGPRRVLFGSDGPWLHPGLELAKIRLLGLPVAQRRLVVGGNLRRLVSSVRRPASRGVRFTGSSGELPAASDPWATRPP